MERRCRWNRCLAVLLALALLVSNNAGITAAWADEVSTQETDEASVNTSEVNAEESEVTEEITGEEGAVQPVVEEETNVVEEEQPVIDRSSLTRDADSDIKFELNAKVSENEVASGGTFRYTLQYTVPPTSSDFNYSGMQIEIAIPDSLTLLKQTDTGKYVTENTDILRADYRDGKLIIIFNRNLKSGEARTIGFDLQIPNYTTVDGTEIVLDPKVTGRVGDQNVTGELTEEQKDATKVTVLAEDDAWEVIKTADPEVGVSEDKASYLVTYTIETQNVANEARNGRLKVEEFSLTDILPSVGLPTGGEAIDIESISMSGYGVLAKGSDYTVLTSGGVVTGFTTTKTNHITAEQAAASTYLREGEVTGTTYTVVVKYPRAPYITESNKPIKKYTLTNTAELTYRLLSKDSATVTDTDDTVLLGEKEVVEGKPLTIQKYVTVLGKSYPLTNAAKDVLGVSDEVKFALYEDAQGTKLATDKDGNAITNPITLGTDGKAVFSDLRYGTYYIKEETGLTGFEKPSGMIKVSIDSLGTVQILDDADYTVSIKSGANTVDVYNETSAYGAVEFTKKLKTPTGAYANGAGYTFTLTKDGKTYTASSDANGKVSFPYLPAGTYKLAETEKPSSANDYKIDPSQTIDVVVVNNQITKPNATSSGSVVVPSLSSDDKTALGEDGIYLNISYKGSFKIKKVDQDDHEIALGKARFKTFGPYASEAAAKSASEDVSGLTSVCNLLTADGNGKAASPSLEEGWYILQETEAPDGYTAKEEFTYIEVKRNTSGEEKIITNTKAVSVTFSKYGQLTVNGVSGSVEELAGAEFEMYYDAAGTEPVCDANGTKIVFKTKLDGLGKSTSNAANLAPGTYYYKETKAPAGYKVDNNIHSVSITYGENNTQEIRVQNLAISGRIQLNKTSSVAPHAGLSGAEFTVYSDSACTSVVNGSDGKPLVLKTGTDGTVRSEFIAGGTYYLKETKAPAGYQKNKNIIGPVEVVANQVTTVDVQNDPLATIKITKRDSVTAALLSGAQFAVYSKLDSADNTKVDLTSRVGVATTANGVATITGLERGATYYIVETIAPSGYVLAKGSPYYCETVTIPAGTPTKDAEEVSIDNDRKGKIVVQKLTNMDSEAWKAFTGTREIQFTIYKYDEDATDNRGAKAAGPTSISSGNGKVSFDNLTPGKYVLVETYKNGSLDGYGEPAAQKVVNVTAGMNQTGYTAETTEVENPAISGKLKIEKVSSQNANTKLKAKFELQKSTDGGSTWTKVEDLTTTNGYATSGWLEPSSANIKYQLVEKEAPAGYTLSETPIAVTIEEGKTVKYTNEADGKGALTNEPQGKITINKVGKFDVADSATDSMNYPLDGAQFKLIPKTQNTPNADIDAYFDQTDVIDSTGKSSQTSGYLDAGEYWLIETVVPEDYMTVSADVTEITVPGTGKVYVYKQPVTIVAGDDGQKIEIVNESNLGKISISKSGDNGAKNLSRAQFKIYVDPSNIPANNTLTLGATVKVYVDKSTGEVLATATEDNASIYSDTTKYALKELQEISASASSDGNGVILETSADGVAVSLDLKPGTYYVRETQAPPGYQIFADTEWTGPVVVNEGEVVALDIVNTFIGGGGPGTGPGTFTIRKYTEILGEKYYVNGVQFAAYRAVEDASGTYVKDGKSYKKVSEAAIATGTTTSKNGERGYYTSIAIPAGVYIIEETGLQDGNNVVSIDATSTQYQVVTVVAGDMVTNVDAEFYNPANQGKFIFKKIDDQGNPATTTVKFKLEKQTSGSWAAVEGYTNIQLASGQTYESDFLPVGHYRLVETNASGYTLADAVEFDIDKGKITGSVGTEITTPAVTVAPDVKQPFAIVNDRQGKLKITKTGSFEGQEIYKLSGVEFKIYEDENLSKYVTKITTGSGGTVTSGYLDAGEYWVEEILPATLSTKYTPAEKFKVIIHKGKTTEVDIDNVTTYGKLKIMKADTNATDKPLKASFAVYTNAECTTRAKDYDGKDAAIVTDGITGIGLSSLLPAGTYYLKEISAPNGYVLPANPISGPYTVTSNQTTDATNDVILNDKAFKIEVIKRDKGAPEGESYKVLPGATIGLYAEDPTNFTAEELSSKKIKSLVSDANGKVTFGDLTVGASGEKTYYVREIEAPTGYELSTEVKAVVMKYSDNKVTYTTELLNDKYGTIQLKKIGTWQDVDQTEAQTVELEGVEFNVYKVSGDQVKHDDEDKVVATITTDENGIGTSVGLPTGWYELVEVAPLDGYAAPTTTWWVEIKNNEVNTKYVTTPIENIPGGGLAKISKWDGSEGKENLTQLDGAEFEVYYKSEENGAYKKLESTINIVNNNGNMTYSSGTLEPGYYKLHEIKTPIYEYAAKGVKQTITFTAGDDVEFKVELGKTTSVDVYNSPNGKIKLTKYGVDLAGIDEDGNVIDNARKIVSGATFQLYTSADCKDSEKVGEVKTTNESGICLWDNVAPGTYWIKEVETAESKLVLATEGYAINPVPQEVVIEDGQLVKEIVANPENEKAVVVTSIDNFANKGRFLIQKVNEKGEALGGAMFDIYDADGNLVVEGLTIAKEGTYSTLMPAAAEGTQYRIVETKAPTGYALNTGLEGFETEQIVTLYPYHNSEAGSEYNKVVFKNKSLGEIVGFGDVINKTVKNAEDAEYDASSQAARSLLFEDYTVDYKIDGYTDSENPNEVGAKKFVITDTGFKFQYNEGTEAEPKYKDATVVPDYKINQIVINDSYNRIYDTDNTTLVRDTANKVSAEIFVQKTKDGVFESLQTVVLDDGQAKTIVFSDEVYGVQVSYKDVNANFVSDGILLNVTFEKIKEEAATAENPEIRKIINTAKLEWEDNRQGTPSGGEIGNKGSAEATAESYVPRARDEMPSVKIVTAFDGTTSFNPGEEVAYKTTVTNSVIENQSATFYDPIVSIKLPAELDLNAHRYGNDIAFEYYIVKADGTRVVVSGTPTMVQTETDGISKVVGDEFIPSLDKTTQYTFTFSGTELEPGDQLIITYSGFVKYGLTNSDGRKLICPAFLSSDKKIEKSKENPKGLSFNADTPLGILYENAVADAATNNDLLYLHAYVEAMLGSAQSIQLVKEVSADPSKGYEPQGSRAKVLPGGDVYYRITLYNNSKSALSEVRIVDILPVVGDSYVLPVSGGYIDRLTNIPTGTTQNLELVSVSAEDGNATIRYSDNDFTNRNAASETAKSGQLGILYYQHADWSSWNASMSDATAFSADVQFGANQLKPGESYVIEVKMKAPAYSADQKEEYKGTLLANSAAAAVVRDGEKNGGDENAPIEVSERVEPRQVLAELQVPTGSIGDYVWLDANQDGIQDDTEEALQGAEVTLTQTKTYMVGNSKRTLTTVVGTLTTDQNGYYNFENLPCNILRDGKTESNDPTDYISNEYYEYTVSFSYPDHVVTLKGAGSDDTVDSDANADGTTDAIRLNVIETEESGSKLLVGEVRTDVDAGFIAPYALGNRVWFDENYNGKQDAMEDGIENVTVRLYTADGTLVDTTLTDATGYYWFTGLQPAEYVIEYDITGLVEAGTQKKYLYDFTDPRVGTSDGAQSGTDSDAAHEVSGHDGRVMRTDTITVSADAVGAGYTDANTPAGYDNKQIDSRWDAGLTSYAAIGGFCFDDQNYDNLKDLAIPLEGTVVELYELDASGNPDSSPIAQTVIGEDGSYYFEHLKFGENEKAYAVKFTYPEGYRGVEPNKDSDNGTTKPAEDSAIDSDVVSFTDETRNEGWITRIDLPRGTISKTWDAGASAYSSIGDRVWLDSDMDGTQADASGEKEVGIPDVRVVLQVREGENGTWTYAGETITDVDGFYEFNDLKSSSYIDVDYRVAFIMNANTEITTLNVGEDTEIDSDAIPNYIENLALSTDPDGETGGFVTGVVKPEYGKTDLSWDAGIVRNLSAVGYYVWYDTDYDGIQDPGEQGAAGVKVVLQRSSRSLALPSSAPVAPETWEDVAETQTDANGNYMFEEIPAGVYRLNFDIPTGYVRTQYNQGTADSDSDASRLTTEGTAYSRAFTLEGGTIDLTWDAGLYEPQRYETVVTKNQTKTVTRYDNNKATTRAVKTGDTSNTELWLLLAGIALLSGGIVVIYRRKRNQKVQ